MSLRLELTPDEYAALQAVPPAVVAFRPAVGAPGWGDLYLDTFEVGWYELTDAEAVAAFYGVPLTHLEPREQYVPRNPRRES